MSKLFGLQIDFVLKIETNKKQGINTRFFFFIKKKIYTWIDPDASNENKTQQTKESK